MDLAQYKDAKGLTDDEIGEAIGRDRVTVSRYRRGLEPIPGDIVRQLVVWSKGQMTADELLGIPEKYRHAEAAE